MNHLNKLLGEVSNIRKCEIEKNLNKVQSEIEKTCLEVGRNPSDIKLVVVTKTYPVSDLEILYSLGVRDFGENKHQEALTKVSQMSNFLKISEDSYSLDESGLPRTPGLEKSTGLPRMSELPGDIVWHYQGQIQSNKIQAIEKWAEYIHAIDNVQHYKKFIQLTTSNTDEANTTSFNQPKDASEILRRDIKYLIQINLDLPHERVGRGGVAPESLDTFFADPIFQQHPACGVMGVAPIVSSPPLTRTLNSFRKLQEISQQLQDKGVIGSEISAGMSGDFTDAIRAGATLIRVGSSILGKRAYLY